ncbi:MAG: hypothetical protein FWE05_11095 [Defluviitaleaceae bacterium]|nr:hypothetical protein [Defluviitaleaceae bacterium]
MNWRILLIFVLVNIVAIALVSMVNIFPTFESAANGLQIIRSQESRYILENRFLADYEENIHALDTLDTRRSIISYDELITVLSEIGDYATSHGLTQVYLRVSEPMGIYAELHLVERIFEMRVNASYTGDFQNILNFLYALEHKNVNIITINITSDEPGALALLDVEFSLFGSE